MLRTYLYTVIKVRVFHIALVQYKDLWAVAVAQFVEWSHPTSEIRESNPLIDKLHFLSF